MSATPTTVVIEVQFEDDHQARSLTLVNDLTPVLIERADLLVEMRDELIEDEEVIDGGKF